MSAFRQDETARKSEGLVRFANRKEAGRALASMLADYSERDDVLLMAIPRGGVPVCVEISRRMSLPLYVLVVEKIQAPWHEAWQIRQTIGAAGPGGVSMLDADTIAKLVIPDQEVTLATECAKNDQAHKEALYAVASPSVSVRGRTVVLIDDAVQTGMTMRVAVQFLRKMKPLKVVIAVPVCSQTAYRELCGLADHVLCPVQVAEGVAAHVLYARFPPVTDATAIALLEKNRQAFPLHPSGSLGAAGPIVARQVSGPLARRLADTPRGSSPRKGMGNVR